VSGSGQGRPTWGRWRRCALYAELCADDSPPMQNAYGAVLVPLTLAAVPAVATAWEGICLIDWRNLHLRKSTILDSRIRRRDNESAVGEKLSNWTRRRVLSWSLFALASIIAIQHLVAHGGFRPIPICGDRRTC
jgi:hypothetical protein